MGPWHSPSSSCRVMNTCVSRAPLMCEARFSLWNFSRSLVSMLLVNKYHVLHISSHRQKRGWFFSSWKKIKNPKREEWSLYFPFPHCLACWNTDTLFPFHYFPIIMFSLLLPMAHIRSHSGSVFACDYPLNRFTDWFMCVTINYGGSCKWYLGVWWRGVVTTILSQRASGSVWGIEDVVLLNLSVPRRTQLGWQRPPGPH